MKTTIVATLAGVLVVLAVVGGFMALDKSLLHVYTSDDAHGAARFTKHEVIALVKAELDLPGCAEGGRLWLAERQGGGLWYVGAKCESSGPSHLTRRARAQSGVSASPRSVSSR